MGDEDLIRRGDALEACAPHYQATLRALPAASSEEPGKEVMPVETNANKPSATGPGVTAGAAPAEDVRAGALTVAQAAQVLLDLLNMRGGHHEGMTREDAQKLWDAASDKHGYAAVSGFLSAMIPGAKP